MALSGPNIKIIDKENQENKLPEAAQQEGTVGRRRKPRPGAGDGGPHRRPGHAQGEPRPRSGLRKVTAKPRTPGTDLGSSVCDGSQVRTGPTKVAEQLLSPKFTMPWTRPPHWSMRASPGGEGSLTCLPGHRGEMSPTVSPTAASPEQSATPALVSATLEPRPGR